MKMLIALATDIVFVKKVTKEMASIIVIKKTVN